MSANLLPLPEPMVMVNRYGLGCSTSDGDGGVFTADQMRAYATLALSAQAAELEALRADAERYRWLRDLGDETWAPMASRIPEGAAGIDAAIDRSRAARETPTPRVTTAAELRQQAKSDTSCVGAFARARPTARTKE